MPIHTSVSSSIRKPGTFQEFDITSAARGLVPITRRVAVLGCIASSATVAAAVPMQMFAESDGDTSWGKGSELALMVRAAFKATKKAKKGPQIWAVGVADPAGTAVIKRFAVSGTATAAGDVIFKICGRTFRTGVANTDTAATVATAMKATVDANVSNLPVTCSISASVNVNLTGVQTGVNGNDIVISVVSQPAGITVTASTPTAGVGAYDITASLDSLVDKHYHAISIANHTSTDVSDGKSHIDDMGAPGVKKFCFVYMASTGSLSSANTLSTTANYKEFINISAEDFTNLPGEISTQVAVTVEGEDDVAKSFDGVELDLFLPPAASVPTNTEIESALAAGTTILTVNDQQDQAKIVRCVTTKTTESSAPFENLLDISNVRSLFYSALQVDAKWLISFQRAKKNERTKKRVKSVTLGVLRNLEEIEILQNVEAHAGELIVEEDPLVPTRLNVSIPNSVVPNLHQIAGVNVLYVE